MLLILMCVFTLCVPAALAVPEVSAKSAIVINAETGGVVYEKNADVQMKIASTTKILTALVAIERSRPDEIVTVKNEWTGIEGSSIYLKPGEKITMGELLYGLLLESGNDAATAIAGYISGNTESFAMLMNEKARLLGCIDSYFVNPHGLDAEGHLSTARDLALITQAAMKNDLFQKIVSTKYLNTAGRYWKNHNKLLWDYEGAIGVKTGYTKSAGRSLVSCAERDGMRFICVTLSAPDDWRDHASLYNAAFNSHKRFEILRNGDIYFTVPVVSGVKDSVVLRPIRDYTFNVPNSGDIQIKPALPQFVYAAVVRGAQLGTVTVTCDGAELARIPLVSTETVLRDESEMLTAWERFKRAWFYANEHAGYRGFGLY